MTPEQLDRVFGRGRLKMVTGEHVEVYREAAGAGERRRYTKRFLSTIDGDFGHWTEREWRILARLFGHGIDCVPEVVQFDRGSRGGTPLVQTYDAGATVDQWATILPVARAGRVLRHVFEDCAHWWALAHHCLRALAAIHELSVVHLDIKGDNVCIPVGPPSFDPARADVRMYPRFAGLALIDFAFALVSRDSLTTALPIGWQTDYDYQSPRLLHALEAGRRGDLQPTRELDWRCDMYSLAAMLKRYLPDDDAVQDSGRTCNWSLERAAAAKELILALREAHDRDVPARRPHLDLMQVTGALIAQDDLAESLASGWTLARDAEVVPVPASPITPLTRLAPSIRVIVSPRARVPVAAPPTVIRRRARPGPAVVRKRRVPRTTLYAVAAIAGLAALAAPMWLDAPAAPQVAQSAPEPEPVPKEPPPSPPAAETRPVPAARAMPAPKPSRVASEAPRKPVPAQAKPAPITKTTTTPRIAAAPPQPRVRIFTPEPLPAATPAPPSPAPPAEVAAAAPEPPPRAEPAPDPPRRSPPAEPRAVPAPPRAPPPQPALVQDMRSVLNQLLGFARRNDRAPIEERNAPSPAPMSREPAPRALPPVESAPPPARAYDPRPVDLAAQGRRSVSESVPAAAARIEPEIVRVLWLASAGQDRGVAEALRRNWPSNAPVTLAQSAAPSLARQLSDDARQAFMANGDVATAFDLQLRAFGANPRDAEVAGNLAFLYLKLAPPQPEIAREVILYAIGIAPAHARGGRVDDWHTLAAASALAGREGDATNALYVALALSRNLDRTCRTALGAVDSFGERMAQPVQALMQRIRQQGRDSESPYCAWPPRWQSARGRLQ